MHPTKRDPAIEKLTGDDKERRVRDKHNTATEAEIKASSPGWDSQPSELGRRSRERTPPRFSRQMGVRSPQNQP